MQEERTKNYYNTHAKEYFAETYTTELPQLWAEMAQHLHHGASILDLGCGSGRDVSYFASRGFDVVGIDYAVQLLRLAWNFTDRPLVLADFRSLPFRASSFDAVWALASLQHVQRQRIRHVLSEIHRVLKAQGLLFSSIKGGSGDNVDKRGRYNALYQQREWESILRSTGYDIADLQETMETRETGAGQYEQIAWITCLATAI